MVDGCVYDLFYVNMFSFQYASVFTPQMLKK